MRENPPSNEKDEVAGERESGSSKRNRMESILRQQ